MGDVYLHELTSMIKMKTLPGTKIQFRKKCGREVL
jgi:hypothetical protein